MVISAGNGSAKVRPTSAVGEPMSIMRMTIAVCIVKSYDAIGYS